ncbi:MAG: carbohydrate kinase [Sulfitobacter sp.]
MILCCGEALIDMIEAQGAYTPHPGGAVYNTAIALGRLERSVGFLSGLSNDVFGTLLREGLQASHVDTSHVMFSDRPTTLAFVRLVNGNASYMFYDENTAGRSLDKSSLPAIPANISAMYFGGISLIGMPAADFYSALAKREASARVIMMDPNIRPLFITEPEIYRERLNQMIACCDILKVSDDDLHWIISGNATLKEKALAIRALGPKVVIVTKGSEGSVAYLSDDESVEAAAHKVSVVDTVGAGDTFNAGVLAKLSQLGLLTKEAIGSLDADDMLAALRFGSEVASITVSRPGANPPVLAELSQGLS